MKRAQLPVRPIKCDIAGVDHKKTVCVLYLKACPDDGFSLTVDSWPTIAQFSMAKRVWVDFCIRELIKMGALKSRTEPEGD